MTTEKEKSQKKSVFSARNISVFLAIIAGAVAVLWLTVEPFRLSDGIRSTTAHVHGGVVHVGTRFDSRIKRLHVSAGDEIKKGDVLVDLDSAHLRARLDEEQARVALANERLKAAKIEIELDRQRDEGRRDRAEAEIKAFRAAVKADQASLALAQAEFDRARKLFDRRIISASRFEAARENRATALAALRQSKAELAVAESERDLAVLALERQKVRNAELAVDQKGQEAATAELALATAELAAGTLKAAHDGLVVEIAARAGGSVRPNDTILTYWVKGSAWVRAWVPETEAARITKGMPADVTIDALPDAKTLEGRVVAVLVAPDAKEQTLPGRPISPLLPDRSRFAVKVEFSEKSLPQRLLPGMSARVTFITEDLPADK